MQVKTYIYVPGQTIEGVESRRTLVVDFSFKGASSFATGVECTRDSKRTATAAMVVNNQAIQEKMVA